MFRARYKIDFFDGNAAASFIRGKIVPLRGKFITQFDLFTVANDKLRKAVVSVEHVDVAPEIIESVFIRIIGGRRMADAPFTDAAGGVAGFLEDIRNRNVGILQ